MEDRNEKETLEKEKTVCMVPDGFGPGEIYALCGALDVDSVFGLEEKYIVKSDTNETEEQWVKRLKEKVVLDENGRLTSRGILLIQALEVYTKSDEYLKMNNLNIAVTKHGSEDNIVILFEDEADMNFRLEVWPRKRIISLLMAEYDFFRKRATDKDYTYLARSLSPEELSHVKQTELVGRPVINAEWFKRPEATDTELGYEHKLFFADGEQIIQLDITEQSYEEISLFYLYKQIFDWLNIPYGEGALIDEGVKNRLCGD